MNSQFNLDLLDEDHRPKPALRPASYDARHRLPEPQRPTPPPWVEHPNTFDLGLVGESTTPILPVPVQSLRMPLPSRAKGAALQAETAHRQKPAPLVALLGQCLHALRFWERP